MHPLTLAMSLPSIGHAGRGRIGFPVGEDGGGETPDAAGVEARMKTRHSEDGQVPAAKFVHKGKG